MTPTNSDIFDAVKDAETSFKQIEERETKVVKAVKFGFLDLFSVTKKLYSLVMLLYQRQNALEAEILELRSNNLQK